MGVRGVKKWGCEFGGHWVHIKGIRDRKGAKKTMGSEYINWKNRTRHLRLKGE